MRIWSYILTRFLIALRFDARTIAYIKLDLKRLVARLKNYRKRIEVKHTTKLHLGCGNTRIDGWLNCDIAKSEFDIDLATTPLPFAENQFSAILAQQVIEHLEYDPDLLNLLKDLNRILKRDGQIWLSCPDMESISKEYLSDRCATIDNGLKRHWPHASSPGFPIQHRVNFFFHQWGEHRNLYDLEMVTWALNFSGFHRVRKISERELISTHPEIPRRENERTSLIVNAVKK